MSMPYTKLFVISVVHSSLRSRNFLMYKRLIHVCTPDTYRVSILCDMVGQSF